MKRAPPFLSLRALSRLSLRVLPLKDVAISSANPEFQFPNSFGI